MDPKIEEIRDNIAFNEKMHNWSNELNNSRSRNFYFHHPNNVGYGKTFESQKRLYKSMTPEQERRTRAENKQIKQTNMVKRILINNVYNQEPSAYYGFRYSNEQVFKAIDANIWDDKYSLEDRKNFLRIGSYLNRNASRCSSRSEMINEMKRCTAKGCNAYLYQNIKRVEEEIEKYLHPQEDENEYSYGRTR